METKGYPSLRASEINFFDLLTFDPEEMAIRFYDRRQVIADEGFLGILHRELVRGLGWQRTKACLLRLGFSAGYTDCQSLRKGYTWESEEDLFRGGVRFLSFKGIARVSLDAFTFDREKGELVLEGSWKNSWEALWHQHFLGTAPAQVCWLLSGYLSGFGSAWWGKEVLVRETECIATGRAETCRFSGKPASEWGEEAQEDLDLLRFPDMGDDLSKMGNLPSQPGAPTEEERAGGQMDVYAMARRVGIIGSSKPMEQCLKLALQVAVADATVLLVGESGTGKELFARLIHEYSGRARAPFVAVNCSALPETLLESELFGHVKGSFTGAVEGRKGLFEAAHRGTILLDEIGDMSPATQVKLLRVIQEKEVRPVGGNRGTPVNVRIIAATNQDLDRMVADGTFREDLYYRLKVFPIVVPPLRERREDIVPLARHFLTRFSHSTGKKVNTLSPEALKALALYDWPGNVRELENILERAVVLTAGDRVRKEDLPIDVSRGGARRSDESSEEAVALRDVERRHILSVLDRFEGHRQNTAKALGIGVNTLWRKLKDYGIEGGPGGKSK